MPDRYAEEANYWSTTIRPAKSQSEVVELLEDFGVTNINVSQGMSAERGYAWLIRFFWNGKPYRFIFTPLRCKYPERTRSLGGKKITNVEQSRFQMGRIAVNFVKAILTASEAQPGALFGFMEIPSIINDEGIPTTMAEFDTNLLLTAGKELLR